jgi:hypothetical protein
MEDLDDNDPPPTHAGWRWLVVAVGLWLVCSAFFWPRYLGEGTDTWVVGLLMAVFGFLALYAPIARYINTALAVYLILATVFFAHASLVSAYNDGIVAAIVFGASFVPSVPASWTGRPIAHRA